MSPLTRRGRRRAARGMMEDGEMMLDDADLAINASGTGRMAIGAPAGGFMGLKFLKGTVMTAPAPVYLIYYGSWGTNSGQDIIENFVKSITDRSADGLVRDTENLSYLLTHDPSRSRGSVL